jgi:DNA-binding MurR/RpiR family transcriptional regulator
LTQVELVFRINMIYVSCMDNDTLRNKIQKILPILNEKQKRIFLASEAQSLGYGGISKISKFSGVSRPTISQGIKELNSRASCRNT